MGQVEEFDTRFVSEKTDVIRVGDTEVHLRLCIPGIQPGSSLRVVFESFTEDVEQAVCISTDKGKLKVGDERASSVILWSDHSLVSNDIEITNRVPANIVVWNAWRRKDGGVDAGLRYAGMTKEEISPSEWRLRCSDGIGEADFDDLVVVVLSFDSNAAQVSRGSAGQFERRSIR